MRIAKPFFISTGKPIKKESYSDFKDWVIDAPGEYIDTVINEWRKGNPFDEDIKRAVS